MGYSRCKVSAKPNKPGDAKLKVGDSYKCPEDHEAKIVWISEDRKTIAVKCPCNHLSKVEKVTDYNAPRTSSMRYRTKEREVFAKNMVFMVKI